MFSKRVYVKKMRDYTFLILYDKEYFPVHSAVILKTLNKIQKINTFF